MASPQVEDGYTKIANELLEALARVRIPGEARQVLDVILRKTYGFGKKEDRISISQFQIATGIAKPNIHRGIRILREMNICIKNDTGNAPSFRINKDYSTWKPVSKLIPSIKSDTASVSKAIPTKENTTKEKKNIKRGCIKNDTGLFERFWSVYPSRNGKKIEKAETLKRFEALKEPDQELCIKAAGHYAASERVIQGVGIKDPKRFIRDGHGNEYWREWIEPERKGAKVSRDAAGRPLKEL